MFLSASWSQITNGKEVMRFTWKNFVTPSRKKQLLDRFVILQRMDSENLTDVEEQVPELLPSLTVLRLLSYCLRTSENKYY